MWATLIKYTLIQSDEVIITATPDLASLRNTKNIIDLLKASRPNDRPPRLILNQVGVPKRPEIPPGEFAKAVGVEPSVVIPYDPQSFGTAASNGQMLAEVAAKSKAVEALNQLADIIMGPAKPPQQAKRGLSILDKLPKLRKK
jgi:pilus assembly protein CpaE